MHQRIVPGKIAALSRGRAEATAPVGRHRSLSLICSLASEDIKKKEGKDSKSSTNAYSRKGRVSKKQMPVTKKERKKDHKCLWQRKTDQTTNVAGKRKMAALIRQANS